MENNPIKCERTQSIRPEMNNNNNNNNGKISAVPIEQNEEIRSQRLPFSSAVPMMGLFTVVHIHAHTHTTMKRKYKTKANTQRHRHTRGRRARTFGERECGPKNKMKNFAEESVSLSIILFFCFIIVILLLYFRNWVSAVSAVPKNKSRTTEPNQKKKKNRERTKNTHQIRAHTEETKSTWDFKLRMISPYSKHSNASSDSFRRTKPRSQSIYESKSVIDESSSFHLCVLSTTVFCASFTLLSFHCCSLSSDLTIAHILKVTGFSCAFATICADWWW